MNLHHVKSVLLLTVTGNYVSVFISTRDLFHLTFCSCPFGQGEGESSRVGLGGSQGPFGSAPIMAITCAVSVRLVHVLFLLSLCASGSSLFLPLLFPSEDDRQ